MPPLKLHCENCTVKTLGALQALTCNQVGEMNSAKVTNTYKKGQVIYYEGNPAFGMHIVVDGLVKLYVLNADGKIQIVRLVKSGDFIGYRALLSDNIYSTTAEALTDSIICFIDRPAVLNLIQGNQQVALGMLQDLSDHLRRTEHLLSDIAHASVRERVACLLLDLAEEFGQSSEDDSLLNISLSREELADCVGTTVESVVRVLSDFRNEGLIDKVRSRIGLLNRAGLALIARHR